MGSREADAPLNERSARRADAFQAELEDNECKKVILEMQLRVVV